MATPTLTSAFFRRIARLGSTKASSKGELLASVSAVWFLIGLLVSLFVIPFWISFVVQVYAVLPWVRRDGYVGMVLDRIGLGSLADWIFKAVGLGSPGIVVPVLVYIWLPFMILPLFTAILRIDPALIEAAQDLGAGSWKTFWNVVVPLSYNGILTGTILVFITTFGSFVEPKILAGSSGLLIGNYIQASFLEFGKLPDGAAASVVVLVPTIALLYVYVAYAQAPATGLARESVVARIVRAAWGRLSALLALLALLPIARKKTDTGSAPGGPDRTRTIRGYRTRPEQLFDSLAAWRCARDRAVPIQLETVPQPHAVHGAHDPEHHPRVVPPGLHPPRRRSLPVALPRSRMGLRLRVDHRGPCHVLHPDCHRRAHRQPAGIRSLHRRGRDGPRGQ